MSSTLKNAKKKLSQIELRQFMQEHKLREKPKSVEKKIESPLAKYNEHGQLTCILCNSIVRSEAVWHIHINAKQHRENIERAKKLKERTNNFTTPLKRPLTPPLEVPVKKSKGILKNATPNLNESSPQNEASLNAHDGNSNLPQDFFDSNVGKKTGIDMIGKLNKTSESKEAKMEIHEDKDQETLPEGFFDDPKLDAKARNLEYKDPIQEEWDRFQKEIKDAGHQSAAIIAEDQEESTTERQIDEIDEQMKKLARVLDLEKKKLEVIASTNDTKSTNMDENSSEEDNIDIDEFLDWRSKNSFK